MTFTPDTQTPTTDTQALPMDAELEALYASIEVTYEDMAEEMMSQFLYQISRRMEEKRWTNKKLAQEAGIKASALSRLSSAGNTSLKTLARLAFALDLKVGALKLIPAEQTDDQQEEIAPFVRTEDSGVRSAWWPTSRKPVPKLSGFEDFMQEGGTYPWTSAKAKHPIRKSAPRPWHAEAANAFSDTLTEAA